MQDTAKTPSGPPVVRTIALSDLMGALRDGIGDFRRAPVFGLVIAGIFVLAGILIYLQLAVWDSTWMILPVAVGFPLIGPFVVVGLYEVSHQIELGQKPNWNAVLSRIFMQKDRQIPSIAFIVTFFIGSWFFLAHLIFALFFGLSATKSVSSVYEFLLTQQGVMMLVVGTVIGAALAFLLFSISVVSIPLLVDREIDFVTGMIASVSAVINNFRVMIVWAALIGALTVLAMIPMFLGLFIVLPVFGHATWHLYRRVLEPVQGHSKVV